MYQLLEGHAMSLQLSDSLNKNVEIHRPLIVTALEITAIPRIGSSTCSFKFVFTSTLPLDYLSASYPG
jgi:hypothetical protein